jgi:hypothetical protein
MAGYPREYVDGTVLYADTMSMDVVGWRSYDQVNNEVWLAFDAGDYIETGQEAGRGDSCCKHASLLVVHAPWLPRAGKHDC